ncbi:Probable low-affinity inorganic phosphate transporter [hydrothermal vent metagenome]|uniref:Probable low-affinity inorganic phosphate transporter n=1 Tax=hydrothermal vent metagenome TaxID=652676 RepID=A0A3B1C586_9ZZZZ
MEVYLIAVVILLILAVIGLIVGVSNDAVNFLNSAIGSKVAPRWVIMSVASIGLMVGTMFSTGMMEVARKGIFHPELFTFPEITLIFVAVMLANILLLDVFNSFALPTSTTVSIVFNMLGAAVFVALIKIGQSDNSAADLNSYINSSKALAIISGILLSVIIAFITGAIIQYFTRLLFTFNFAKKLKRYGAIWGAVALTAITFFIVIKGAKHSTVLSLEIRDYIAQNTKTILLYSIIFWAIILQLVMLFTKANILKFIVLIGTFALALAFAANDLVNFIGVPLAGLSAYSIASNSPDPLNLLMTGLNGKVETNSILLLITALIMVATLWFSKKARAVTKTEINLSRQADGDERFESSALARTIVRSNVKAAQNLRKMLPDFVIRSVEKRFQNGDTATKEKDTPAFDLIRASVNLMVASILISYATSYKLPLSTTYVTFMVAMGTSFSDKAWGRESAVYRVSGVITVITGWFLTALIAFFASGFVASIMFYGGAPVTLILILLSGYILYKNHLRHKEKENIEEQETTVVNTEWSSELEAANGLMKECAEVLEGSSEVILSSIEGLISEDRKIFYSADKQLKREKKRTNNFINHSFEAAKLLDEENLKLERRYGKIIAALQQIFTNTKSVYINSSTHVENTHYAPNEDQSAELKELSNDLKKQIDLTSKYLRNSEEKDISEIEKITESLQQKLIEYDKNQIRRIKEKKSSTRNSKLYFSIVSDFENISTQLLEIVTLFKKNYRTIEKIVTEGDENITS